MERYIIIRKDEAEHWDRYPEIIDWAFTEEDIEVAMKKHFRKPGNYIAFRIPDEAIEYRSYTVEHEETEEKILARQAKGEYITIKKSFVHKTLDDSLRESLQNKDFAKEWFKFDLMFEIEEILYKFKTLWKWLRNKITKI